jgi:SAM-dependent methyltransferase
MARRKSVDDCVQRLPLRLPVNKIQAEGIAVREGVPDTPGARRARHEIEDAQRAFDSGRPETFIKPFGPHWSSSYWTKWAAVTEILQHLEIWPPTTFLDVGCGTGWTTLFLAEAGYSAMGLDVAPAHIRGGQLRAQRWHVPAEFIVGDMESFELGRQFGASLVFDALHHSKNADLVIANIARHLDPGGWVIFGEPSWLHKLSGEARETVKTHGWVEEGVPVSSLKRNCRRAGLTNFRRFFEGTGPYHRRLRGFGWQLIRLVAANAWVAPQASIWLAAQKPR